MAPTSKKKLKIIESDAVSRKSIASEKQESIKDVSAKKKTEGKRKRSSKNSPFESTPKTFCDAIKSVRTSEKTNSDLSLKKRNIRQSNAKEAMVVEGSSVDKMNVQQLLALGEQSHVEISNLNSDDDFQVSTDSDNDFEEVKNSDINEPVIPKEGVNITLETPNISSKHKKKGFDLAVHLKRQMNRVRKDLQLLMHKVHVLSWIAHLRYVNSILNHPIILSSCSSFVKCKNLFPSKYSDLSYLEGILKWFHKNFDLKKDLVDPLCTGGLLEEINYQFKQKQAFTCKAFILMFVVLLRIVGLRARVVMSFQVLPVKPSLLELYADEIKLRSEKMKTNLKKVKEGNNTNAEVLIPQSVESKCSGSIKRKSSDNSIDKKVKKEKKAKKVETQDQEIISNDDEESESEHFKPKNSKKKVKSKSGVTKKDLNSNKPGRKLINENKTSKEINLNDEDNDFTPKSLTKKNRKSTIDKKEVGGEQENVKKKQGSDIWVEVYLEAEEKWLSVDVPRQKIHCIGEIYSRATHPVTYIIACNNDSTLKDVTKRYVPSWHSDTRKRRVDEDWWNDTMKYFLPAKTPQDKEEDEDINRQLLDQPLPSSISEFKDHPMYALKRHLLKFEAIYPPDAPTLGFVRGEPVYARECVFTLHSREMWYKQARLVRLKEEPYKIVKARPKYDKMTGEVKKDLPLELFGKWQTEDYIPPVATGGKVPRNEYGNVDLFKPCMLPIGTVHLQIPALNRIAKKLDIDCAPATVGFDFHSGGSHPVFDGFVVCEEFKDVLLDAWNKEIDESSKKEEEKKEKRVYGNWKRLIRGLLIREKLKVKYAFGENSDEK